VTLRAISPAPLPAVLDLYTANAPLKPIEAKAAVLQVARSETEGWYLGDDLIAAAMFYPLPPLHPGERHIEVAFVCLPVLRHHLVAFIHAAQLTRARLALNGPVRVRALVRSGHRPGARLAVLCGMSRLNSIGAFDHWEFADDRICQRHQVALQRA
jgi:hypothetical protein